MTPGDSIQKVVQKSVSDDSNGSSVDVRGCSCLRREENISLLPKPPGKCSFYVPARVVLAIWSFLGFVSMFALRMDINLAILDMAYAGNDSMTEGHANNNGKIMSMDGSSQAEKFHWSDYQQYMILSAFYYGYCSTQMLGGYLSGRYGGKLIFGMSSVVSSLLALATPYLAARGYGFLIACRVGQGLAQGLAQPCMHTLWANWAPEKERTILMAVTYAGCQLGNVIATLVSSYLCAFLVLGGWPSVFYFYGGAGVIWSAHWFCLIHDRPSEHPHISQQEREYIERNIHHDVNTRESKVRWTKVLKSPALLAIIAAHFANDWGSFALTTCLPKYLKSILKYDLTQNGFLSSLPFLVLLVTNPLSGYIADSLRARQILTTKNTRKVVNSIGLLVPSGLIMAVTFCDQDRWVVVVLFTLAVGMSGFTMAGYSVNHLDIAPTFAGILYGITNTIGTTTGFIGPVIVGALTDHQDTADQWHIFFYLTSGIFFMGGVLFILFAQGEPQDWVVPSSSYSLVETDVEQQYNYADNPRAKKALQLQHDDS